MKISTDSILLGAWTELIDDKASILDIGAGTGIISLMMAQKNKSSKIDAIEFDENSFNECVENFKNSSWQSRLTCFNISFQEFVISETKNKYSLIVTNPPFYSETLPENYTTKHLAKFAASLPFTQLINGVLELLTVNGIFSVIIPFKEKDSFIELASNKGLFPFKITNVKGNENTDFKRSLIAFKKEQTDCFVDELILEKERNTRTEAYKNLTQDFYL